MTHATYVTLENVSYHLPDGSPLFTDLNVRLDQRLTGLVGRNGVGKRVLARLIAEDSFPSAGRCLRNPDTLVMTSHDERFLAAIGITHRLYGSLCGSLNWLEQAH